MTTKVADFHKHQPHGVSNHLLSTKASNMKKQMRVSHSKLS